MKEIKAKQSLLDEPTLGEWILMESVSVLAPIVCIIYNFITRSQLIVEITITMLICLFLIIVFFIFILYVNQMFKQTIDIYTENSIMRKCRKKKIFEVAWTEIEEITALKSFFICGYLHLDLKRNKDIVNEIKDKLQFADKNERKSAFTQDSICSFISYKQFIELQKICPLEIKMDLKVQKKLEKYKAKHKINTQL